MSRTAVRARHLTPVILLAGLAASCDRRPEQPPTPSETPPAPAVVSLPEVITPPTLTRADLLAAIDEAASAYAAGTTPANDPAGRRFLFRQAFGCAGPTPPGEQRPGIAAWSWGAGRKTVELRLAPADWKADPALREVTEPWEAVEGVWLTQPWLRSEGCAAAPQVRQRAPADDVSPAKDEDVPPPSHAEAARAPAPSAQVAGLAAVFAPNASRVARRQGKPYAFTVRGADDASLLLPLGGYRLVVEGRLVSVPGGRSITCAAAAPDQRPVCIASAEVHRVAFEGPDGKVLSEWKAG